MANRKQTNSYCSLCLKCVRCNQRGILCDSCNNWYHAKCVELDITSFNRLANSSESWFCPKCFPLLFPFSSVLDDDAFMNLFHNNINCNQQKIQHTVKNAKNAYTVNFCKNIDIEFGQTELAVVCNYYDCGEMEKIAVDFGNSNNISCFHLNCRSLFANYDNIVTLLHSFHDCFDIIVLTETWLDNASIDLFPIAGYRTFFKCRSAGKGGGIIIYVKDCFNGQCLVISEAYDSFEYLAVSIMNENNIEIAKIAGIYRPPKNSVKNFLCELQSFLEMIRNGNLTMDVILCGDFNINLLHVNSNANVMDFLEIMYSNYMFPCISKPTRVTRKCATLIDNIFISNPFVLCSGISCVDISDHFPIFILTNINTSKAKTKPVSVNLNDGVHRYMSPKNLISFRMALSNENWDFLNNNASVNDDYDNFVNIFVADYYQLSSIPLNKPKATPKNPWMSPALLFCCEKKQKLYKKYLQGLVSFEQYKNYKNRLTGVLRAAKTQYFYNYINCHKKDSRAMWRLINEYVIKNKKSNSNINNVHSSVLNNFFANLGANAISNVKPVNDFKTYLANPVQKTMFIQAITVEEIKNVVNKLPPKTSSGFDNINMKIIKSVIDNIAEPLCKIFNKSFSSGIFPDRCKIAKIIPVFKSGDPNEISNYRPISLLPTFSKILEKLMYCRIINFLNKHNVLNQSQHGFRQNHSTNTAIANILNPLTTIIDKHHVAFVLFIDISKAFDSLSHDILLYKLNYYGIRGIAYNWFKSYISNRYHYTDCNYVSSSLSLIRYGIPQGSILGPLLYLLYVNDIFTIDENSSCVLYADDTSIIISGKNVTELRTKLHILDFYVNWFCDNKLAINVKKTNYMLLGNVLNEDMLTIQFNGKTINRVSSVRYLGIMLDDKLAWSEHTNLVREKAAKGLGMLKLARSFLPNICLLSIYYSFVYPYLINAIEFWGNTFKKYIHPIEVLQKSCIRILGNVSFYTSCKPVAKQLSLLMLDDIYFCSVLNVMYRVFNNMHCSVLQNMFTRVFSVHAHNTTSNLLNFYLHTVRKSIRRNFIAHNGVILWNGLPNAYKVINNFNLFKKTIKTWLLSKY